MGDCHVSPLGRCGLCGALGLYWPKRATLSSDPQFETFLRTHQGAVRAFLRRLTGETAIADELAQDTFLKTFRVFDQLADESSARAWVYRIAYRRFLDRARRESRRRDLQRLQIDTETTATPKGGLRMDLEAAMRSLPPERRVCIMLGLALGHSHSEITSITGLPLGTVKSHIDRGRVSLREQLSAYEEIS